MLPQAITVNPSHFKSRLRYAAIMMSDQFGNNTQPEHIISRKNSMVGKLLSEELEKTRSKYLDSLPKDQSLDDPEHGTHAWTRSDLMLPDSFLHSRALSERFEKNKLAPYELLKLTDPYTRYWNSYGRGLDKHVANYINKLDHETYQKTNIKPY